MSSISLHKFGILPEDEGSHVFSFVFENPQKLFEVKSVESSEVNYGGHRWSIVCMRKEEKYLGIYLKWRYSDGLSSSSISCKAKYTLALIHRLDYGDNRYFQSNQKFTTSQSLLGKSKFIQLQDLVDLGSGYLDETGKRVILELSISKCTTRFEKTIDTSPKARTKKNVSGYYFDTTTFLLSNHRWYLRVYPTKVNSSGLPAVYLYIASKPKGISVEMNFRLYVGEDSTELLTYNYGEGAKYDGFGKTLSQPLYNTEKMMEVTIGVEVVGISIWKDVQVSLRPPSNVYAPHLYNKDYNSSGSPYRSQSSSLSRYGSGSSSGGGGLGSLTPAEAFPDQEGNFWKAEIYPDARRLTVTFDKAVHHYQQNKTKLLCWSATLLSRDVDRANDLDMLGEPIVGYFSNFIDEKGFRMTWDVDMEELEEKGNPYTDGSAMSNVLLRVSLLSLQTLPLGMRSIPRFDYQNKHLIRARRLLQEKTRSLEDMREMAASRASLSFMDSSRDDLRTPDSGSQMSPRMQLYKSYDSLDWTEDYGRNDVRKALSTGDMMNTEGDDDGKGFFSSVIRHIAETCKSRDDEIMRDEPFITCRDLFHGTREDVSTESGIAVSDESSLFTEARPSPVDVGKQKEIVATLIRFLQQRLPIRISEVLEFGSQGSGTSTRSRMDVDLILFSPDLPVTGQAAWMPAVLQATSQFVQNAVTNPDPFYPLPKCELFTKSTHALQFTCGGVDIDIMFSYDWDHDEASRGAYTALYDTTCKQETIKERQWCALGSARLQKKFVTDQPNEVKEIIKVVKHWRNCVQWKKTSYRPSSYLLTLLVVHAVEDTRSVDMKSVLQRLGALILAPELSISWSTFYLPERYTVDFEPPTPLVRDPANPGFNVASTLPYWGQFRTELILWLKSIGVNVCNVDS